MSAKIGTVELNNGASRIGEVWASLGGVELRRLVQRVEATMLTPIDARNYAALLIRAADEVERMWAREESE